LEQQPLGNRGAEARLERPIWVESGQAAVRADRMFAVRAPAF
jgi:hypothetical protein